jgi:DNA invertase Pin-like site-specific DNA recombinase
MSTKLRCAIYTRKSTEEGLDQAFNSLHAQREACEAYIISQAGEGWSALKETYDDGGFSGGSMDRPALARLLADIGAGRIDVVVVYKVDRLTRSLANFAKIVEAFDAKGVSFVSVTQAFNTTSSMGRLTLNVLLSFAQFEREVTGERIRDKIAASKAKGMWMGGGLPLGYDAPVDLTTRALVVNPAEAETVRRIFALYLEVAAVEELKRRLAAEGLRPKASQGGNAAAVFSRGALYHLLKNRTYLGEIPHRDKSHPGAHAAIVERDVFDAVQQRLAKQTQRYKSRPLRRATMRLAGRLFDAYGSAMGPTFTKGARGQVYSYYASSALKAAQRPVDDDRIQRVPGPIIERLVSETLAPFLSDDAFDAVIRVEVHATCVHMVIDPAQLIGRPILARDAAEEVQRKLPPSHRVMIEADRPARLRLVNPIRLALRGGRTSIVDAEGRRTGKSTKVDPVLVRALRASHELLSTLGGAPIGYPEAAALPASPAGSHERNLIKLAFLAPDLQAAILEGRQPPGLTLQAIVGANRPPTWADQRAWAESLA